MPPQSTPKHVRVRQAFLEEWAQWRTKDGFAMPLPSNWQMRLNVMCKRNLNVRIAIESIPPAMRANIPDHARFDYWAKVAFGSMKTVVPPPAKPKPTPVLGRDGKVRW